MHPNPTFRPLLAILAAVLFLPFALASHDTSSNETLIINGNSDPTTATASAGCSQGAAVSVTSGTSYVVILGAGDTSGTTIYASLLSAAGTLTEFRVTRTGTITNIRSGVTAHLLYHENLSVGSATVGFWAAVRYVPDASFTTTADIGGPSGTPYYLQSGSVSAGITPALIGSYTQSGGPCGGGINMGRLFDPSAATGGDFTATLTPFSSSEILVQWNAQSAAYYHGHINTTNGFSPSANDLRWNTTAVNQTNAAFNGLFEATNYCVRIRALDSSGSLVATSNQTCATTHRGEVNFTGNTTRVVPDNVTIYITRPNATEYIIDCARVDPTGAVQSVCTADNWPADDFDNNYTFRYPQSLLNTTTAYAGTYLLYVVNSTGSIVNSTPFCIQSAYSATCESNVGPDLETQLGQAAIAEYGAIQTGFAEAEASVDESSVRTSVITALAFAVEPSLLGVPNIAYWYVGCIVVAAIGVMGRSRMGA